MSVLLLKINTQKFLYTEFLNTAIKKNKIEQIKILANIIEKECLNNYELFALVWKKLKEIDHSDTSQQFLEKRDVLIYIGLKIQDCDGNTLLHNAIDEYSCSNIEIIARELLSRDDRQIERKNNLGNTPLHHAAEKNHLDAAMQLIELNAEVNAQNREGDTPLHLVARAASRSQKQIFLGIAEFLINKGANLARKNNDKKIPYQLAGTNFGIKEHLQLGIETIEERMNLVREAIEENNSLETRFLLLPFENIDDPTLFKAAFLNAKIKPEIISLLIKKQAPFSHEKNRTPLMEAIRIGNYSICLAIKHFQNTQQENLHDDDGNTLFHFAAQQRDPCFLELLDNKNGLNSKNKAGKTPLVVAIERKLMVTAKALIHLGADREEAVAFFDDSSVHNVNEIFRLLSQI